MLELADVHTYYGESHVLHGVSLEVKAGSLVALLGRNGMGKTTTIRTIIGFNPPRNGRVRFMGSDIAGLPCDRIARMGIGLVPQGRRPFPSLSVEENLTMSARNTARPEAWTLDRVYALFPVLRERAKVGGALLSGGEQQMLSIGRALMTNPGVLLMDEPSEGLSPAMVREVGRTIVRLRRQGVSILLVEQNVPMALAVADYVYVISRGVIVHESVPRVLAENPELKARHLGVGG
jgi:branched-chain amino acid transport system ATP-binding protein